MSRQVPRIVEDLAATIIDEGATPGELWHACHDLYELLLETTGLPVEEPKVAAATMLPTGKAIAPVDAARCLLDPFRTRAFAGGVVDAVAQRRRMDPHRPVHVLYAGCGPFASLVLPALTRFSPEELRCTLIDLHQQSIDAVGAVMARFGLDRSVESVAMTDATTYRLTAGTPPDIVVVECLLRGLSSEPQVAITWNLVSQCGADVTVVPAEIALEVVYAGDLATGFGPTRPLPRVGAAPIFTLSRAAVAEWGPYDPAAEVLPAGQVTVGRTVRPPERLALATTIRTHEDRRLGDYRSGLNHPHPLEHPARLAAGTELAFRYSLTTPGIEIAAIS